jgi:hypothetical protein
MMAQTNLKFQTIYAYFETQVKTKYFVGNPRVCAASIQISMRCAAQYFSRECEACTAARCSSSTLFLAEEEKLG